MSEYVCFKCGQIAFKTATNPETGKVEWYCKTCHDGPSVAKLNAGTIKREKEKIGRNAACPCLSGKKFKKCCGK